MLVCKKPSKTLKKPWGNGLNRYCSIAAMSAEQNHCGKAFYPWVRGVIPSALPTEHLAFAFATKKQ